MKTILVTIALSLVVLVSSCTTQKTASDLSWEAYCVAYNVNPSAPTEEEQNYFLDCWSGSVEEEQVLAK